MPTSMAVMCSAQHEKSPQGLRAWSETFAFMSVPCVCNYPPRRRLTLTTLSVMFDQSTVDFRAVRLHFENAVL